jgi:hypothetical protein
MEVISKETKDRLNNALMGSEKMLKEYFGVDIGVKEQLEIEKLGQEILVLCEEAKAHARKDEFDKVDAIMLDVRSKRAELYEMRAALKNTRSERNGSL